MAAPTVGVTAAAGAVGVLEVHRAVGAVVGCTEAPSERKATTAGRTAGLLWLLGFHGQQPCGDAFGAVYALQQQPCCRSCGVLLAATAAVGTICRIRLCWGSAARHAGRGVGWCGCAWQCMGLVRRQVQGACVVGHRGNRA
jgi:hypothetical protein